MSDLELITVPKSDLVSFLDWAWKMPGFALREDAKRLRLAVGLNGTAEDSPELIIHVHAPRAEGKSR